MVTSFSLEIVAGHGHPDHRSISNLFRERPSRQRVSRCTLSRMRCYSLPLSFLSSPVSLHPAALSATHQCVDPHRAQHGSTRKKNRKRELPSTLVASTLPSSLLSLFRPWSRQA